MNRFIFSYKNGINSDVVSKEYTTLIFANNIEDAQQIVDDLYPSKDGWYAQQRMVELESDYLQRISNRMGG
jgi:hypothetical protein